MKFNLYIWLKDSGVLKAYFDAFKHYQSDINFFDFNENKFHFGEENSIFLIEVHPQLISYEGVIDLIKNKQNSILILTSEKNVLTNKQIADFLLQGADDYVDININPDVLMAKIKAHIRRLSSILNYDIKLIFSKNREILIDRNKNICQIKLKEGKKEIHLTQKEIKIFSLLLQNEGKIVKKENLFIAVWGDKAENRNIQVVDKYIQLLRDKIKPYDSNLKTIYGEGYIYESSK